MEALEPVAYSIQEGASGTYTATIVGNDEVTPLADVTLSTLTLTLYVVKIDGTKSYIRGTASVPQNILNANNVIVTAAGLLTWTVQPADTALVEAVSYERHIALFEYTWPGGAGKHEIILVVKNLSDVP